MSRHVWPMPPGARDAAHGEEGTASVELVAAIPFLLLGILVAAQIALAGQALWSASVAAMMSAQLAARVGDGDSTFAGPLPEPLHEPFATAMAATILLPAGVLAAGAALALFFNKTRTWNDN